MAIKINSNIHWQIEKLHSSNRQYVSRETFQNFVESHFAIYEIESIHRDDTDFKVYSVSSGKAKLIGWADYYQQFFYIFN